MEAAAVIALPENYRKRLRTTNRQERLNEQKGGLVSNCITVH